MRLNNKVAVITGAAEGIGKAIAELFAEEGARVILLDKQATGNKVANQIIASGGIATFIRTDISSEEEVKRAMAQTEREHGYIDILVNNAAVFILKGLDATVEEWHLSLEVNIIGTSLCTRYASNVMKKQNGGSIVNLSSISGCVAQPEFLTYSATKAAIINMTRCMALDLASYGIRVNCVCPGTIRTQATDRHMKKTGMTEEQFIAENAPLHIVNRVGTPREVAFAVLFLASEEASFITATSLMVDGGYIAR
ncbi:MAG: SDR family oxidoreductase [Gammaproteobacteria bacterium]|nr:SDR family oxidoreductase [Gammaproteobacteria bacterium]